MDSLTHEESRRLIQDTQDRSLTYRETAALDSHLSGCSDCRDYQGTHSRLIAFARQEKTERQPPSSELSPSISGVIARVNRRRRIRTAAKTAFYASLGLAGLMVGFVLLPAIVKSLSIPAGIFGAVERPEASGGVPVPTETRSSIAISPSLATRRSLVSRTPTPTRTPLPLFDFHALDWDEVRYFNRGTKDTYAGSELPSAGVERQAASTIAGAIESAGLEEFAGYRIPEGFTIENVWVYPAEKRVDVCYVGPRDGRQGSSQARWCVRQQSEPFADFIGLSGRVFPFQIDGTYAEYASGGWLGVEGESSANDDNRFYSWDEEIVPVLRIRFALGGLFVEVSGSCDGHGCSLLDIADSVVRTTDDVGLALPTPTRTPLPLFDFHVLDWEEVRYFNRGEKDIYRSDELPYAGIEREQFSNIVGAVEASGLEEFVPYFVPETWKVENVWYYPAEVRVDVCYTGPQQGVLSRLGWCVRQQREPFADFIGQSGRVFPLYIDGTYAEYIKEGGWLGIGREISATGLTTIYEWNEQISPYIPRFRFAVNDLYIELYGPCSRDECPMLDIADRVVRMGKSAK